VPPIKFAFALINDDVIEGVVTYGPPASPQVAASVTDPENAHLVLELNRLCVESKNKNAASMLVGRSLDLLPARIIVSYADSGWNHCGYVYQATNFKYSGTCTTHDAEYIVDGKRTHSRTLSARGITAPKQWARDHNIEIVRPAPKHRYFFVTGSRRDRRILQKLVKWPIVTPYPKSDPRRYDAPSVGEQIVERELF
jgi:hypothetical protein